MPSNRRPERRPWEAAPADGIFLLPGPAHPHPPATPAAFAAQYDVPLSRVEAWIADGLPRLPDGRIEAFACCNWLSRFRLDQAPALARRWRAYLNWFRPFLAGGDGPRRWRWRRTHRLFLPVEVARLRWYLPRVPEAPHQRVVREAKAPEAVAEGPAWRIDRARTGGTPELTWEVEVAASPRCLALPEAEAEALRGVVGNLIGDFAYGYRHHRPHGLEEEATALAEEGSCLDCAALCLHRLRAAGWRGELVGGIIAKDFIANPHFWVEVLTGAGPAVIDPSLPAIARMLGEDPEPWIAAYVGGCDARRIELARGPSPISGIPGGPAFSLACGEAAAEVDGTDRNCWPCLDWVCGECEGVFWEE